MALTCLLTRLANDPYAVRCPPPAFLGLLTDLLVEFLILPDLEAFPHELFKKLVGIAATAAGGSFKLVPFGTGQRFCLVHGRAPEVGPQHQLIPRHWPLQTGCFSASSDALMPLDFAA